MNKIALIVSLATSYILLFTSIGSAAPFIYGPYRAVIDNDIVVGMAIGEPEEFGEAVRSGVEKEITYTIELLRAWEFWPDEFVVSKRVTRNVKYDNLRDQYLITYIYGDNQSETMIKTQSTLREWLFDVKGVNLLNIKDLIPGTYYIRAIVEVRSINKFPVIGFITHFIPESKMTLAKESEPFIVEASIEKP